MINETRRKPSTGARCPTLSNKRHRIFYIIQSVAQTRLNMHMQWWILGAQVAPPILDRQTIFFFISVCRRLYHLTWPLITQGRIWEFFKGGGGSGPEFFEGGGGGFRVQVRGNFHILTSKKKEKQPLKGRFKPPNPPPLWIRYCYPCSHTCRHGWTYQGQSWTTGRKVKDWNRRPVGPQSNTPITRPR